MKAKWILPAVLLTLGFTLIVAGQTATKPTTNNVRETTASQNQPAKTWHLPKGWTADQAYKSNCTRCHAEVPKLNPRQTNTIVRHMRVRANITHDEAEAILQYLNK